MQPSRDVIRLVEIMRRLRDPDGGCPWDLEQSFETIASYTVEEAYEVVDAIERRDPEDLREELGDLLLQVVYHAQLASELGLFGFEDVVETVTRKMVRRHPHVFGDETARTARSAKGQWERIKAEERAEKAQNRAARLATLAAEQLADPKTGSDGWTQSRAPLGDGALLDQVPGAFPALMLALKVQEKAATVDFDWTEPQPIFAKAREELDEFEDASISGDRHAMEDEFGDVLFSLVNLGRHFRLDPDTALRRTVMKFRRRLGFVETRLRDAGRTLAEATLDEMEALWQQAKHADGGERAPIS